MTVLSIQLCQALAKYITMQYVSLIIALGPIVGAYIIWPRAKSEGIWIIPDSWRRLGPHSPSHSKELQELPDFHEGHVEMRSISPDYHIGAENDENSNQDNVRVDANPKSSQI